MSKRRRSWLEKHRQCRGFNRCGMLLHENLDGDFCELCENFHEGIEAAALALAIRASELEDYAEARRNFERVYNHVSGQARSTLSAGQALLDSLEAAARQLEEFETKDLGKDIEESDSSVVIRREKP